MVSRKKGGFARHAKSSAFLVSMGLHGALIVIALSFVAVTVIQKEDQTFVAETVKRPKMKLRKLTMPVKMEKKRKPKPKLRKRILVKKEVKTAEIKMPEMTGIKGGTGYLDGGGGLGGLGFGGLDINFFGIMGGGKHVVFIIDYSASMRGEKEAIMRREAARVLRELPRETEFGVIFFAGPAWPASSGLSSLNDWVCTGGNAGTYRPKDWNDMPKVRYKRASKGVVSSMIDKVEDTPLVYGTVYDCPIYMALSMDPMPETIFFMTDGACSTQRGIESLRKMVSQLKASGKKVPVMHTVGFGISSNAQLKQMADLMGGECNFLTTADYNKKYGPSKKNPKKLKSEVNVKKTVKSVPSHEYPVTFSL